MNIALWILAGGVLGWIGYVVLNANEARGMVGSIIIGAVGGFAGGKLVAPIFGATVVQSEFSMMSLVVAAAMAAGLLAIGNLVSNRFNV
jgi:uncharacterized membrane protein YeaQ/YmgE (transglycosylase-associated protein family)